MCELPVSLVEQAIIDDRCEQILVLGKAIAAGWDTVRAILHLKTEIDTARHDLDHWAASFSRLQIDTAKKALQFYRLRQQTVKPASADDKPGRSLRIEIDHGLGVRPS